MLAGAVAKGLQALCVALSLFFVFAVVVVYVSALRSGDPVGLRDFIILLPTFFATLFPASYVFRSKRLRERTVMVASFGWATGIAVFYALLVAWYLADGFPAHMILQDGFPGNALNFGAIMLFTANGLLAFKSQRQSRLSE